MKKRIFTAVLSAAMCCTAVVPAMTSIGTSDIEPTSISCLKGDANLDSKATIADSVAVLQHIGNRDKYGLKPQGLINADIDGIAGVTANDALEMQKIDSQKHSDEENTSSDDVCQILYKTKIDWDMGGSFKEDIWEKISGGYSGVITNTDELKAYMSEIYKEETVNQYLEKYNDAFFEKNVLLADSIIQGSGTSPKLTIESVSFGDTIIVDAQWHHDEVEAAVVSMCFAQVVLSKDAYTGQEIEWTCNKKELPFEGSKLTHTTEKDWYCDFGNELTEKALDVIEIHKNYDAVIRNTSELKEYLSPVYREDLIIKYLKKYDDSFFNNNVLIANSVFQCSGADGKFEIHDNNVNISNEAIDITAKWNCGDAEIEMVSVCFVQVSVAKELYSGQPVNWNIYNDYSKELVFCWLDNLDYIPITCDGLPEYELTADDGTVYLLNFSGKWIWKKGIDAEAKLPDDIILWLKNNAGSVKLKEASY